MSGLLMLVVGVSGLAWRWFFAFCWGSGGDMHDWGQSSAHTVWRLTRSRIVPVGLCFACALHGRQCTCGTKK